MHTYIYIYISEYVYIYIVCIIWFKYLAHEEPRNLWVFFQKLFCSSIMMKKTFLFSKHAFFFLNWGKKHTLSHTWCRDISWSIPLDNSNPFIGTSLGSIPLSTLHVDYISTPLALAGSSHKKEPDALGTCRTTLVVITVNLESLAFFPKKNLDKTIKLKHGCIFSLRKNLVLDCQNLTESNKSID